MAASKVVGPNAPIFVSYGAEDYFLDQDIALAKHWPNRDVQVLDVSEGVTEQDLLDVLEMPNADGSNRTIILDGAQKLKEGKGKVKLLREYVDAKRTSDLSVVLMVVVRSEKLSDLWSYVGAKGR